MRQWLKGIHDATGIHLRYDRMYKLCIYLYAWIVPEGQELAVLVGDTFGCTYNPSSTQ